VTRRLAWALYRVLSWPLRLLRIRFIRLAAADRIGHLCSEPDSFVKAGKLGRRPPMFPVLLSPPGASPNDHLLGYWRRYFPVVRHERLAALLRPFLDFPRVVFETHRYIVAINGTAEYVGIQREWEPRAPLLALAEDDRTWGEAHLREMGVPEGAWYVCFHSREGGYSPSDEHMHRFRNSEVESYREAVMAIRARGGWCVRMGDPTMRPLPEMDGVVDYAHSLLRSDRMDVFLCASCRFFLGNTSGLFFVSCVFGVPAVVANSVPVSTVLPFGSGDIGIPKLVRRCADGRLLSFPEIFSREVANYRFAELYERDGLEVVDNTADEICAAAVEMLDRLEGKMTYTEDDEALQSAFKALMKPGHYTYGGLSRVGRDFLRKHRDLLLAESVQ